MSAKKRHITIITGISGAGKSVALKALEDVGFYCIDNLPANLLNKASLSLSNNNVSRIAFGLDIRAKNCVENFENICLELRTSGFKLEIFFLEAGVDVLIRRFKETRRPHPLLGDTGSIRDAIIRERKAMLPVSKLADCVIDTSDFSPHQTRDYILKSYAENPDQARLRVSFISFGFKYGVPSEADIVMDVRFLPNPYFVEELKHFTGLDRVVADFVFSKNETKEFLDHFEKLLQYVVPQYLKEGKSILNIALGCTGGRHRSPALVEHVAENLRKLEDVDVFIFHRELDS